MTSASRRVSRACVTARRRSAALDLRQDPVPLDGNTLGQARQLRAEGRAFRRSATRRALRSSSPRKAARVRCFRSCCGSATASPPHARRRPRQLTTCRPLDAGRGRRMPAGTDVRTRGDQLGDSREPGGSRGGPFHRGRASERPVTDVKPEISHRLDTVHRAAHQPRWHVRAGLRVHGLTTCWPQRDARLDIAAAPHRTIWWPPAARTVATRRTPPRSSSPSPIGGPGFPTGRGKGPRGRPGLS